MSYFLYKKNKVIDKLTDNQIFIKKLTERYGLLVKKLSLSNKSTNSNIKETIKNMFMKYEEDNSNSIIDAIQKESNKKTKDDISIIRNFLTRCHLLEFFHFANETEEVIDKIIANCCINCQYQIIKKDTILYRINDIIDNIYIIIKGRVGVFRPFNAITYMSGFKYFRYIYDLYLKKENYILKIVLEQNYKKFPIKERMLPKLNENIAKKLIQKFSQNPKNYIDIFTSVEDILKKCYINIFTFKTSSFNTKIYKENFNYELLSRTNDYNEIYVLEYNLIHEYKNSKILNPIDNQDIINNYNSYTYNAAEDKNNANKDFILNEKSKNTIKILSDTHLCCIDLNSYYNILLTEYKKILHRDAKYLIDNFIFKQIARHFEKKYFPFFVYEELNYNDYLFRQNKPVEYIYFLKEGVVELSINKNIFQIDTLIKNLNLIKQKKSKDKEEELTKVYDESNQLNRIMNNKENYNIYKTFISKDKEKRLVIIETKDIIGLECLYYDMNYFYNAKINSKKAIFYKIRKSKFEEIIFLESHVEDNFIFESERKIDFLILRLSNLNKVKLNLIQLNKIYETPKKDNKKRRNNKKFNLTLSNNNKMKLIKLYKDTPPKKIKNDHNKKSPNNHTNIFIINKKRLTKNIKSFNDIIIDTQNNINKNMGRKMRSFSYNRMLEFDLNNNSRENRSSSKGKFGSSALNKTSKMNRREQSLLLTPVIFKDNVSLKYEKILLSRVQREMTCDNLFNKINDIAKDNINNSENKELRERLRSNPIIMNMRINTFNNDFVPWKYFHLNTNLKSISILNRRKMNDINWYKDIYKFNVEKNNNEQSYNENKFDVKIKGNNDRLMKIKEFCKTNQSFYSLRK